MHNDSSNKQCNALVGRGAMTNELATAKGTRASQALTKGAKGPRSSRSLRMAPTGTSTSCCSSIYLDTAGVHPRAAT